MIFTRHVDANQINEALDELARVFAVALKDVKLRKAIKEEALKMFDGDYDILYKNFSTYILSENETVEDKVAEAYRRATKRNSNLHKNIDKTEALSKIKALVKRIPKFQISVTLNIEKWDAESYIPIVAYHPAGVREKDIKEIIAYDCKGNKYRLNPFVAPENPVIVLGISERTDENGNLKRDIIFASNEIIPPDGKRNADEIDYGSGGGTGSGGKKNNDDYIKIFKRVNGARELLKEVYFEDVGELCWTLNNPEIILVVKSLKSSDPLPVANFHLERYIKPEKIKARKWLNPNEKINMWLYNWNLNSTGDCFLYYWYEDDESFFIKKVKITYTYENLKFEITLDLGNNDEELGYNFVNFNDPMLSRKDPYSGGLVSWYNEAYIKN